MPCRVSAASSSWRLLVMLRSIDSIALLQKVSKRTNSTYHQQLIHLYIGATLHMADRQDGACLSEHAGRPGGHAGANSRQCHSRTHCQGAGCNGLNASSSQDRRSSAAPASAPVPGGATQTCNGGCISGGGGGSCSYSCSGCCQHCWRCGCGLSHHRGGRCSKRCRFRCSCCRPGETCRS
jgi:hypothetical protein